MRENWIEWVLLTVACLAAAASAWAYFLWFRGLPAGGPADWSDFGDYFSGVLNPLIGIITVVLIVLTLRTTRREAEDTRYQMKLQIDHLRTQTVLTDMHKRLDGALAEWNRMLDQTAPPDFQFHTLTALGQASISKRTTRELFDDPETFSGLVIASRKYSGQDRFVDKRWLQFKHDLVPLLGEIDRYCEEYDQKSNSRHLTSYYRARVRQGVRCIQMAGVMADSVHKRLIDERS